MDQLSITAVDVLIVAVILASAALAAWRGLVAETFAIVDWVAAAFVALRFTPTFQPLLRETISPAWLEYSVVFIGTFLLIFIPLSIMSHRLSEAVKKSEVGPVDRSLGFIFGVGRGLVVAAIAYVAISSFAPDYKPDTMTHAQLFPVVRQTSELLLDLVPDARKPGSAEARATQAKPANSKKAASESAQTTKTYGAGDRSALDRLIETTGNK